MKGPAYLHGASLNKLINAERKATVDALKESWRLTDGHKAKLLFTLKGSERDDWFGVSIGRAGDVNQDGFADIIVGSGRDAKVQARIFDGKDGSVLHELSVD